MRQKRPDPLIIVSLGRSGSTLLMRVLNAVAGVYIFGEHGGAFRHLRKTYEDISRNQDQQVANGERIIRKDGLDELFVAWASPFQADDVLDYMSGISGLYLSKLPDDMRVWGFKEIIYDVNDLIFFSRLWPNLKIIFLRRNIEESMRSAYGAFYGYTPDLSHAAQDHLTRYQAQELSVRTLTERIPDQVLEVDYEAMCELPKFTYARIFSFLGLGVDIPWDAVERTANLRVDYVPPEAKHDSRVNEAVQVLRKMIPTGSP